MSVNEFILDIFAQTGKKISSLNLENTFTQFGQIVLVCPEHPACHMLIGALQQYQLKHEWITLHVIQDAQSEGGSLSFPEYVDAERLKVWNSVEEMLTVWPASDQHTLVYYFTNFRSEYYTAEQAQNHRKEHFENCLHTLACLSNTTFVFVPFMPVLDTLPSCCNAAAEREIEVLWRDLPQDSPQQMMLQMEEICRRLVRGRAGSGLMQMGDVDVKVNRLDAIFGPGIDIADGAPFYDAAHEILDRHTITIGYNDHRRFYSALYIMDAISSLLLFGIEGRSGNIYHVSSFSYSLMSMKNDFHSAASSLDVQLVTESKGKPAKEYHVLNAKKSLLIHPAKKKPLLHTGMKKAITHTFLYFYNRPPYLPQDPLNVYYGRIDRIREMELQELDEIDRICKENNIRYILAGGSMLGAIRHGGFIPWDDDVDIAMLPDDYERFLKICPGLLSENYTYQNFSTDLESHYIHDKIRIEDTYFSTRYSNQYRMANGVYVDVFVYYKTSDNPFLQKIHLNLIRIWRRVLGIRWADHPRRGYHYTLSKILLPIMRAIPFRWYHLFYKKLLGMFEKRNTHYRIDSGFNLMKCGAFPAEWFDETVDVDFCGHKYPVPKDYDKYLRHWFGDHYMELLPISSRTSVHDVVRIDLGRRLLSETEDGEFHHADLRGELYEEPLEP